MCFRALHTNRNIHGFQSGSIIVVVRDLLDRKRSEEHLLIQSSNERMKTTTINRLKRLKEMNTKRNERKKKRTQKEMNARRNERKKANTKNDR